MESPRDGHARRYLGQVLAAVGRMGAALREAQSAIELAPDDPRAWSDLGRIHAQERRQADAIACFSRSVRLDARYADGWHNLGVALRQARDLGRAFEALKQALLIDSTRSDSYLALGNLLAEMEQIEDAVVCFERAAEHDPALSRARSRLAQELSQHGAVRRAESLFREALALDGSDVESWHGLGRILEDLGQAESAIACYSVALGLDPTRPLVLSHYLGLVREELDPAVLERAVKCLTNDSFSNESRALVGYGLAKYLDRRGNSEAAADAASMANKARRRHTGRLDRDALRARIDGLTESYSGDFFSNRRRWGIGNDQPVFIVGLPRSGTTLTEQILSAHPAIHGAGELPDLARLAVRSAASDAPPWTAAATLDANQTIESADAFLSALRRTAPRGVLRIIDKSPLNFFHLAYAALLFPGARVIHCVRDPRDTALSIWLENFTPEQHWATDFHDLAFYAGQYRRLMAHWHEVLPLSILDVRYEDTVADLEGQARRLIEFLSVPWDDRCLDFHRSGRAVQTPSRWQVRQPIYTRSVGRWKNYRDHLPELAEAFAGFEDGAHAV